MDFAIANGRSVWIRAESSIELCFAIPEVNKARRVTKGDISIVHNSTPWRHLAMTKYMTAREHGGTRHTRLATKGCGHFHLPQKGPSRAIPICSSKLAT